MEKMDFSPKSPHNPNRHRRPSDLYSTFIVHDDAADDDRRRRPDSDADIYATMVYKGDGGEDDDDEDSASLPPLLQRLPKDFGAAVGDEEEDVGDLSGTFIVHEGRPRSPAAAMLRAVNSPARGRPSPRSRPPMGAEDPYSTSLARTAAGRSRLGSPRESLSTWGTMIRRTGGVGYYSTSRGEKSEDGWSGFSGEASLGEEGPKLPRKVSVSSIPESIAKEDPSSKYELLNELGQLLLHNLGYFFYFLLNAFTLGKCL